MQLTRRGFLALHAAAAATLAIPAELRAEAPAARATFDDGDRAILAALGRATYGDGADALDVPGAVQIMVALLDEGRQGLVVALPGLFNQLSRVLVPTGRAWIDCTPEVQTAALVDWETSPLAFRRQVLQALRQLVLAACYTNPAVFASLDYPGPWLGRLDLPVHPLRFGEAG